MPYLIVLVIAVVVVLLVMRAAAASGRRQSMPRPRPAHRPQRPSRPLAPDDDPEFLRELERRARRDDGQTT